MHFAATPAFGETADATEYLEESQGGAGDVVPAQQPEEEEVQEPEVEEVKVDPVETVVSVDVKMGERGIHVIGQIHVSFFLFFFFALC